MNGSAVVGLNPLPLLRNVTGGGVLCAGATGVPVGLNFSDAGIRYDLYRGGDLVSAVTGTGAPLDFGTINVAGIYTVRATYPSTGCAIDMMGAATVVVNSLPVVYSVTGGGSYCFGSTPVSIGVSGSQASVVYRLMSGGTPIGADISGSGSAISFGSVSVSGVYSVLAVNSSTGCSSNMAGTAIVTVNPLPTVFNVTGGGSFCAGGGGLPVGVDGSESGVNYLLYNGVSIVGMTIAGTGSPISFGTQTAGGVYTVRAIMSGTGCVREMAGDAALVVIPNVTPAVDVSAVPGTTVCAGTAVTFNANVTHGGTAPLYEWRLNGGSVVGTSATYSMTPVNGNVVRVKLKSNDQCVTVDTAIASVTINVRPNVLPYVDAVAVPGNILCAGTQVTFKAMPLNGGSAPEYTWYRNGMNMGGGSLYSFMPVDGDEVKVGMVSNAQCRTTTIVNSSSVRMSVSEKYIPVVYVSATPQGVVKTGQKVTFKAHTEEAGPSPLYSWAINGVAVEGADSAVFATDKLEHNDSVSCYVIGSGLCGLSGFNFLKMQVLPSGVESNIGLQGQIAVVPNPTSGKLRIEGFVVGLKGDKYGIQVHDVLGRVVYDATVQSISDKIEHEVVLPAELAEGTYLFSLKGGSFKYFAHFVLKR
jgi:hypothetical protein